MATHSYDRGGQPDGTIEVCNAPFYPGTHLCLALVNGDSAAHLTAEQALELAADLVAHASTLRKPSDEDKIWVARGAGTASGFRAGAWSPSWQRCGRHTRWPVLIGSGTRTAE